MRVDISLCQNYIVYHNEASIAIHKIMYVIHEYCKQKILYFMSNACWTFSRKLFGNGKTTLCTPNTHSKFKGCHFRAMAISHEILYLLCFYNLFQYMVFVS